MAAFNTKEFYEKEIEFANKMIGFSERNLTFLKGQMKRERAAGKDLVEHVWSRGVLTELEMRTFGCENFKTGELKKLEKEARQERKRIRKYKRDIERYEAKLATYK